MENIKTDTLKNSYSASTADEMINLGRRLSSSFIPGTTIALTGSLGAGKTTFVKGVALGLGIFEVITSPSFTIIKEYYDGRLPLYHMDLYRIDDLEELYLIGIEELIYGNGLSIIEWSEKAKELLPDETIKINIRIESDGGRTIDIEGLKE
ncbi:MAG: tRNA (adenosine(37)-N6)-threonylcarbamoyltransferase complex ATPase subunit type 1 TsaE [Spirochaetales bacterium]|nr:tRNA (adenosine(37)-N6)-threonylcarbamoyltransferase complex ATPase subunit type 1 TsaE [Spirochaetales bacterium]